MSTGLAYLREHLELTPLGAGQWKAPCPCHEDREPSLSITLRPDADGRWRLYLNCPPCGANGAAVCAALGLKPGKAFIPSPDDIAAMEKPNFSRPLPSPAEITVWQRQLRGKLLRRLLTWRGLSASVVRDYGIGWDGAHYTLPVYENGRLVNVRRAGYLGKLQGWPGLTSKRLYPDVPAGARLILVEGEWDALVGRTHGLPTLTTTGGAAAWPETLVDAVRGRKVAVCLDSDLAGRRAAQALAGRLVGVARSVRVVDLYPQHGATFTDLSDWLNKDRRTAEELLKVIRAHSPLVRKER